MLPSISICAHGHCGHPLPYLDCTKRNTARVTHAENPAASHIDIVENAVDASHLCWDVPNAPNNSVSPGLWVDRPLQLGVVLRGMVCRFLAHDTRHAIYLAVLTHVIGNISTIHLQPRFLLLRVPATSRGPNSICPWAYAEGRCYCEALVARITPEVLRAARLILAGASDSMTSAALKLATPIHDFLRYVHPPAQFVNTCSDIPGTHFLFGAGLATSLPVKPEYSRLPVGSHCMLPRGDLVCTCRRPTLGAADMLGDDVLPPPADNDPIEAESRWDSDEEEDAEA